MAVLVIHLDREDTERRESSGLSGLELGISLYREYEKESPVVMVAPSERAVRFSGSAFFSFIFHSPVTDALAVASSGLAPGYSMYRLGYEAVVIAGRARRMQVIGISADGAERIAAEAFRGLPASETEAAVRKNITDTVLSIGRAGENGVLFASLQSGGREAASMGLGCLFGWKNLKGIIFPGFPRKDSLGNGRYEKRARRHLEKTRIARMLRKEGGGRFIDSALRLGWLPVRYYTDRFDPRAYFLDGRSAADLYGVYPESCQECYFSCGRRTKDNGVLPTWEEAAMLGSNLGFFSLESVRILADAVHEEGLGAADTGALLAYLATLPGTDYTLPVLKGKGIGEYVRIIHLIGENRGLGEKLSQGLYSFPGAVMTGNHLPLLTDLRGDRAGAVLAMLGLPAELPASWLLPTRPLSDRAGAVMALYEAAYRYALVSDGYSPMGTLSEWWGRLPRFIFRFPFLLRIAAILFRAYGLRGRDILERGMALMDTLSAPEMLHIPQRFTMEPESAFDDGSTVSAVRLSECYRRERRIAEMVVKSRREKRRIKSSESSAAVGPSDDLGRDGDPGLQNTTPFSE